MLEKFVQGQIDSVKPVVFLNPTKFLRLELISFQVGILRLLNLVTLGLAGFDEQTYLRLRKEAHLDDK